MGFDSPLKHLTLMELLTIQSALDSYGQGRHIPKELQAKLDAERTKRCARVE